MDNWRGSYMQQPPTTIATQATTSPAEAPGPLMRLYAVIWWLGFASFTVTMFVWTVVLLPITIIDRRRRVFHVLTTCVWGWAVYALNPFWSLRVEGRSRIPWEGRALLVANHDSLADILVVAATFRPFKFVSKESVFKVPFLGWGMRLCGYIPLRRGDRASVMRMLDASRGWLRREVPVLMFPEGTRSPDGIVQPFKNGAFELARDTDSPVIPIVLAGTRDALPKHGLIAPLRSHVLVRVLDPVYPADFADVESLRNHVRSVVITEKARLTTELERERPVG